DIEYFKFTNRYPIHTTIYNPLAGGLLAKPVAADRRIPPGSRFDANVMYQRRYWSERFFQFAAELERMAENAGLTMAGLAYAWVAGVKGVDSILVGPASREHLEVALDAYSRQLP